jgi:hypothetical protein
MLASCADASLTSVNGFGMRFQIPHCGIGAAPVQPRR